MDHPANDIRNNVIKLLLSLLKMGIKESFFYPNTSLRVLIDNVERENKGIFITGQIFDFLQQELVLKGKLTDRATGSYEFIINFNGLDYAYSASPKNSLEGNGLFIKYLSAVKPRFTETEAPQEKNLIINEKPLVRPRESAPPQGPVDGFFEISSPAFDPTNIEDEGKFADWLNDFCEEVAFLKNPKPKDLIFNPNKKHPYITVVGGLKAIKKIYLSAERKTTERIAKAMLFASKNPKAIKAFEEGGVNSFETDIAYRTRRNKRFRVNLADVFDYQGEHGINITMRVLPEKPLTFEELNLPEIIREQISNLKMGLVLINGTTGSGKSTTMAAILDCLLKTKSINLLTIENPIEVIFPPDSYPNSLIIQREVGMHTIDPQRAMQSAVRQTLNIAMVGEIRNAADMSLAFDLAISGHLILATLHAGTVQGSINRIIEMFPPDQERKIRELLSTQYKMGLAQILVEGINKPVELVLEIMRMNKDIQAFILQEQDSDRDFSLREIIEMYTPVQNTQSLDQCMVKLLNEGKIKEDTLMFNSPDPDSLIIRQNKLNLKLSNKWDPTGALIEKSISAKFRLAGSKENN